ncbi:HlyD family efflux transporter periplasmic adaptor subunit [Oceanicoccus sagamiensis]|uniref:HlyD family efflux transporter periplasmic adaptor subunit n=1 Tax=Oceanicoccus sagamiensis TaxID=716816 RepID=UPI000A26DB9A|nr:HlyD family efflux transporter periplasmic adaptor subunit [Oceanicoccus sagamiensis]
MADELGPDSSDDAPVVTAPASADEQWSTLKDSYDPKSFSAAWLQVQSQLIGDEALTAAVVFGTPDQGPFEPTALWPAGSLGSPMLIAAVQEVISQREPVVKHAKRTAEDKSPKTHAVASPLIVDGQICGAVAFEVSHVNEQRLEEIASQLAWGAGWLEVNIRRNKFTSSDRLVTVLELVATSLHHQQFIAAATAVATELATLLGCERAAIGFLKGQHTQLYALSHTATVGKKANLVRSIEAVMDESIDQHATIVYPPNDPDSIQVTRAHEALAKEEGSGVLCTIPLTEGDKFLGALVLERPEGEPFDKATVELCEHAASLIGPLLEAKRKDDRWIGQKVGESAGAQLRKLYGPKHMGLKFAASLLLLVVLFFSFAEGDYRVTADARLEGTIQRSIAVPVAGYIVDAQARAGDIVKQGDLLFSLDDRDLRLERLKWKGQKLKSQREYSEAQADYDRAKAQIITAQISQADAEIALLDEQLDRIRVVAPFDSFIVSGDLSQSLGAPVERGDVLFEVAPLDSYRVILEVDERDIAELAEQQTGKLVLSSAPEDVLMVTVKKITPLSSAEEGRNYFRVEASLDSDVTPLFRPGMEGVAKIEIEQRKLIWIWTYKITHWIRMFFWSWWP